MTGPVAFAAPVLPGGYAQAPAFPRLRRVWLVGTIGASLGSFVLAVLLAPDAGTEPGRALSALLLLGYTAHIASTGWFFTLPEVRTHARAHRTRYVLAPAGLVLGGVAAATALSAEALRWGLLAYFAWQFFHFQKQNLGLAALAASAQGTTPLTDAERRALSVAGVGGITALLAHPQLLQLRVDPHLEALFIPALLVFGAGVGAGLLALARRGSRPSGFIAVYLFSLFFFAPVFIFDNPYAAVAGLTIAHSWQYLLVMGLLSAAPRPGRSRVSAFATLFTIAMVGGIALSHVASQPDSPALLGKALFGAYLGVVMAHFVVDAGIWRLRDEFPRRFHAARLPYLIPPPAQRR